jgi:hypothetical protein
LDLPHFKKCDNYKDFVRNHFGKLEQLKNFIITPWLKEKNEKKEKKLKLAILYG